MKENAKEVSKLEGKGAGGSGSLAGHPKAISSRPHGKDDKQDWNTCIWKVEWVLTRKRQIVKNKMQIIIVDRIHKKN